MRRYLNLAKRLFDAFVEWYEAWDKMDQDNERADAVAAAQAGSKTDEIQPKPCTGTAQTQG